MKEDGIMRLWLRVVLVACLATGVSAVGCGGGNPGVDGGGNDTGGGGNDTGGGSDTGGGGTPMLSISAPSNGTSVPLPADGNIPVSFTVTNFTLMAPGSCAGAANCGHVHLTIDGQTCNAAGSPY